MKRESVNNPAEGSIPPKDRPLMRNAIVSFMMLGAMIGGGATVFADEDDHEKDFGRKVQHELSARSEQLFGVGKPVAASALGPYTAADNANAVEIAKGLTVSVVSNVTDQQADMIAFWPDDEHPTHVFVCVENFFSGNNPNTISVQRVALNGNPNSNVETIIKGISSCDPIKRTPWGTLIVGEESGADGSLYEIFDPLGITGASPVVVSDRITGAVSDPARVVKRQAAGSLSWEGIVILEDGTMYFGDENRPSNGKAGGGVFKFVPAVPYLPGSGPISNLSQSPLVNGAIYGMRLGTRSGNTDYGQGSEIGKGIWLPINPATFADGSGNIILRKAQLALELTGYYRPEDMDRDPVAAEDHIVRVCWTNTGRMTNGVNSDVENGANYGEVLCLVDEPNSSAVSGAAPLVTRFLNGDPDANHFDNVAFQPKTGNLVILEDGEAAVLNSDGSLKELRGNDIWMCLPDGTDRDLLTDGCIRIVSIKDTDAEATGVIFTASGRSAYVNLQHRATGQGALLKISGFRVSRHD